MNLVVLVCAFTLGAQMYSSTGFLPIAPFLASRSGVGALLSAQGLASCICLVPTGCAVDRWGSEYVLKRAMVVYVLSLVFTAASTSFVAQMLGRIANGAGGSMLFSSGMSLIMERFKDPLRSEYIGTSMGVASVADVAGAPLAGYIYGLAAKTDFEEPQAVALAPAAVLIALAYIVLRRLPEVPFTPKEPLLEEPPSDASPGIFVRLFGVYAVVGVQSWVISITLIIISGAQAALLCVGPLEMHAKGASTQEIGLITVPASLLQMVVVPWGGKMAGEPRKRRAIMILSPLLLGASLACCSACARFYPAGVVLPIVVAIATSSMAISIADAPSISLMSDLAVAHGRGYGEAMSASELAVTAGNAIGPSIGVLILTRGGFDCLCLLLAGGAVLVSASCAAFLGHVECAPQSSAT